MRFIASSHARAAAITALLADEGARRLREVRRRMTDGRTLRNAPFKCRWESLSGGCIVVSNALAA